MGIIDPGSAEHTIRLRSDDLLVVPSVHPRCRAALQDSTRARFILVLEGKQRVPVDDGGLGIVSFSQA